MQLSPLLTQPNAQIPAPGVGVNTVFLPLPWTMPAGPVRYIQNRRFVELWPEHANLAIGALTSGVSTNRWGQ